MSYFNSINSRETSITLMSLIKSANFFQIFYAWMQCTHRFPHYFLSQILGCYNIHPSPSLAKKNTSSIHLYFETIIITSLVGQPTGSTAYAGQPTENDRPMQSILSMLAGRTQRQVDQPAPPAPPASVATICMVRRGEAAAVSHPATSSSSSSSDDRSPAIPFSPGEES
jgi:hypothetical protein